MGQQVGQIPPAVFSRQASHRVRTDDSRRYGSTMLGEAPRYLTPTHHFSHVFHCYPTEAVMEASSNLILGCVRQLEYEQLRPFFGSLAAAKYEGQVCIFADDVSRSTLDSLDRLGIQLETYDSWKIKLPFGSRQIYAYRLIHPILRLSRTISFTVFGPEPYLTDDRAAKYASRMLPEHQARYPLYMRYLREREGEFRRIMISDIRDVVIQRDPFGFDTSAGVSVVTESPRKTIGECPWNAKWIKSMFGREVLDELSSFRIVCSGVTFASYDGIMEYLQRMTEYLTSPLLARNVGRFGLNQAVHNYLIWKKKLEDVQVFEHGAGPVLHMSWIDRNAVKQDSEGNVLNDDGAIVNVAHQYDRHPKVAENVQTRYAGF